MNLMKETNPLAHPFTAWSGHRLFQVVAGTLISVMAVTQASAMLPTPEQALDNPAMMQTGATSSVQAVNSTVTAALVGVDANGQETLIPVDANTRLASGNVLEYQGYFTNTNADRVRKMTVTMSIPEQVELIEVVAPEFPFASVDGNSFARMPLRSRVDNQLVDVDPKYYKAVRWDIESVGLNDTAMVKYRAKVK